MTNHWADLYVWSLFLSWNLLLLLACIFMAIDSHVTEKSGKSSGRFRSIAKFIFVIWFLNSIACFIFGIISNLFSLEKWEMWASYALAVLIGVFVWMISMKQPLKKDKSLVLFSLLLDFFRNSLRQLPIINSGN